MLQLKLCTGRRTCGDKTEGKKNPNPGRTGAMGSPREPWGLHKPWVAGGGTGIGSLASLHREGLLPGHDAFVFWKNLYQDHRIVDRYPRPQNQGLLQALLGSEPLDPESVLSSFGLSWLQLQLPLTF